MKKIIFILLLLFFFTTVYSEKVFRVLSRGSVRDNSTGLTWTRCSLSDDDKPVYDFNCKGTRKKFTWSEGIQACEKLVHEGRSDWRLPSVRELQSIVFYHHYSIAYQNASQTVETVFPNIVSSDDAASMSACRQKQMDSKPDIVSCADYEIHYWSSTTHKRSTLFPWFTDFLSGATVFDSGAKKKFVRCVAGP